MNQEINGLREGYWEYYWEEYYNGNLMCKGHYKNGLTDGYWEWYYYNGCLKIQEIYI